MYVLAIESSTSSAKALLYDTEQGVVLSSVRSYGAMHHDGRTNTEKVFRLSMEAAKEVAAGKDIAAIGLCGTWHGLSALHKSMEPATDMFSWDFTETALICDAIMKDPALTDKMYRKTGCMPHTTYPRHALTWLKQNGVDLTDKTIMTQGAYNLYRLTGEFMETVCTMSGCGLIELKSKEYDPWILEYLGIKPCQLGTLVDYHTAIPLGKEGAELLGLKAGIPVVPAHADGALNQIGNYAGRKGVMTMSVGTSGAIRLVTDEPVLPLNRELWCYCGVEKYITGAAVAGACNCIEWYMEKMIRSIAGPNTSYADLEAAMTPEKEIPVFLPFLYGERCPGWNGKRLAGFQKVDSSHNAADLYQAVQLGVLCNLYQCYKNLCRENGEPKEIILSGGIIHSKQWTQMAADLFKRDILVANCPHASSMGAAALALYAAGVLENINEFQADYKNAVKISCDESKTEYYQKHYERYLDAYAGITFCHI